MERIKTGIEGLDELIEGGFPKGRTILLSGGCGTGKSIFGLQFLYKGAAEQGEPGIYVTMDERPELLRQDMLKFGWDIKALEDARKLVILDFTGPKVGMTPDSSYSVEVRDLEINQLIVKIMDAARSIGAKRAVIDSLPALGFHLKSEGEIREIILKLGYMLSKSELTTILISEIPEQSLGGGPMNFSKYGIEEYVADAVILLHYLGIGTESNRTLYIRKMRGTKHAEDIIPMKITEKGIILTNPEEAFNI